MTLVLGTSRRAPALRNGADESFITRLWGGRSKCIGREKQPLAHDNIRSRHANCGFRIKRRSPNDARRPHHASPTRACTRKNGAERTNPVSTAPSTALVTRQRSYRVGFGPTKSRFFVRGCLQNRCQARDCEQVNRIKEGEAGASCFGLVDADRRPDGWLARDRIRTWILNTPS